MHWKSAIRRHVGNYPVLFYSTYGLKPINRHLSVQKDTDFVIEGFPRSGNTFSVLAFQYMHSEIDQHYSVAHHLHVVAQIKRAIKFNIPILILIRHPLDCVSSLILREPLVSIDQALRGYVSYYSYVKKHEGKCVISNFHAVTKNYGVVIDKVNRRFGTDFLVASPSPEQTNLIFQKISAINQKFSDGRDFSLSAPSIQKKRAKAEIKSSIYLPQYRNIFSTAESLYGSLAKL